MSEVELIDIFADNLRYTMKDVRISQAELAKEARLSESTISRYLSKERLPTVKALINLCVVLNCDVEDLIPVYDLIS